MKRGKNYIDSKKLIESNKLYDSAEAMALAIQTAKSKFDETIELHVKLGVDPRHADQQVRGVVVLPHGTGKTVRVLVIAKGEKADEAAAAGADYVGAEDMIQKITSENWFDFDAVVTTPDMMGLVGRSPAPSTTSKQVKWSTAWTRPPSCTSPSARSLSGWRS